MCCISPRHLRGSKSWPLSMNIDLFTSKKIVAFRNIVKIAIFEFIKITNFLTNRTLENEFQAENNASI